MPDIETMIEDAERHGRESEPDHEVGDLQALVRVLWAALPPAARATIATEWRAWDADDSDAPITKLCAKCDAPIHAPLLAAHERELCAECGDDRLYRPRSVEEVRAILVRRNEGMLCSADCPGWAVFETTRGMEIQICDDCNTLAHEDDKLDDEDVAQLPEAQEALARAETM
jgi:hypothetical protein